MKQGDIRWRMHVAVQIREKRVCSFGVQDVRQAAWASSASNNRLLRRRSGAACAAIAAMEVSQFPGATRCHLPTLDPAAAGVSIGPRCGACSGTPTLNRSWPATSATWVTSPARGSRQGWTPSRFLLDKKGLVFFPFSAASA